MIQNINFQALKEVLEKERKKRILQDINWFPKSPNLNPIELL